MEKDKDIANRENTGWTKVETPEGWVPDPKEGRSLVVLEEVVQMSLGKDITPTLEHVMVVYDLLRTKSVVCQDYLVALTQAENDVQDLINKLDSLLVDTEFRVTHRNPCSIHELIRGIRGLIEKVWRP